MSAGTWRGGILVLLLAGGVAAGGLAFRRNHAEAAAATAPTGTAPAATARPPEPPSRIRECYLGVAISDLHVEVPARVAGSVRAVAVDVGDAVEPGDLLARLDTDEAHHELASERAALAAAQADARGADLRVDQAEHAHRRKASLTDILSKEQIEESRYELDGARLEAEAAAARVRQVEARIEELETVLARSEVVAPRAGLVGAVHVDPGAVVARGAPVVRLIGGATRIRFAVPPEGVATVPVGTAVRVLSDDLGREAPATVSSLAPEIDPESQMVFAEAAFGAQDRSPVPVGAVVRVAAAGGACRDRLPLTPPARPAR